LQQPALVLEGSVLCLSILTRRLLRRGEFTFYDHLADRIDDFVTVPGASICPYRY